MRSNTSFKVSTAGSMLIWTPSTVMVPAVIGGLNPLLSSVPELTLLLG